MANDYDSILTATDSNVINRSEFYATGKEQVDYTIAMETIPYSVSMDSVVLACFFLIFSVLSIALYHRRHTLAYRFKSFFTPRRGYSNSNVNKNQSEWLGVLSVSIVCSLSLGILLYYCLSIHCDFPDYYDKPYWTLFLGAGAVFVFIYLRALLYTIINWVFFDNNDERQKWTVGYFLLVVVLGYVFGVLAIASVFLHLEIKNVTLCTVFVYALYEILHLYKLFVNFKFKRYGALLIFLYFCSVEILPIMLIGHVLEWVFNSYFVYNLLT